MPFWILHELETSQKFDLPQSVVVVAGNPAEMKFMHGKATQRIRGQECLP